MSKIFKVLFLTLLAMLFLTVNVFADSVIVNGSFETGDYTGWTLWEGDPVDPFGGGTWGIAKNGETIYPGSITYDFHDNIMVKHSSEFLPRTYLASDGEYLAYQLQNEPQNHRIYQDVTLPPLATTLSWDMFYETAPGVISESQFLGILIRDLDDNVLELPFGTYPGDPTSIPMTHFTSDISKYAGKTIRLDVLLIAKEFFFDAGFDNFRVERTVPIDIKPKSCPNLLDPKSTGTLSVAILGTYNFDVRRIDPLSVMLEGVSPIAVQLYNIIPESAPPQTDDLSNDTPGTEDDPSIELPESEEVYTQTDSPSADMSAEVTPQTDAPSADMPGVTDDASVEIVEATDDASTDMPEATDAPSAEMPESEQASLLIDALSTEMPAEVTPQTDTLWADMPKTADAPSADMPGVTDDASVEIVEVTDDASTDMPEAADPPSAEITEPEAVTPLMDDPSVDMPEPESVTFQTDSPSTEIPESVSSQTDNPSAQMLEPDEATSQTDDTSADILARVSSTDYSFEDVATPHYGEECSCNKLAGDGYIDLTFHFSIKALAEVLDIDALIGQIVPLTLTGKTIDGLEIKGKDCVLILEE